MSESSEEVGVRWLTRYGPEGASSRYRVYQFLEDLAADGFSSRVSPLAEWNAPLASQASGLARRVRDLVRIGNDPPDVVVVQKEPVMPPAVWPLVSARVRRHGTPLIWDVDDAVWLGRGGAGAMATGMAKACDLVVAGNDLIAAWMERSGARSVVVVPTCFHPAATPQREPRDDDAIEVVWIGSPATARLLAERIDVVRAVLANPRVRLTLVGGSLPDVGGSDRVGSVEWSPTAEHAWLSRADYGLALQPRSEYADHKCGFKIIQYMAYGVVPIASDGPVHRAIVSEVGVLVDDNGTGLGELTERVRRPPTDLERQSAVSKWRAGYDRPVGAARWSSILRELA